MPAKRVLSVGQCAADQWHISRLIEERFSAEVVAVDSAEEALAKLHEGNFDLLLVNRVFDADGGSGIALIAHVKKDDKLHVPAMLVSNYEHYQQEAVEAGALMGFGKAELSQPTTISRLRTALGTEPA